MYERTILDQPQQTDEQKSTGKLSIIMKQQLNVYGSRPDYAHVFICHEFAHHLNKTICKISIPVNDFFHWNDKYPTAHKYISHSYTSTPSLPVLEYPYNNSTFEQLVHTIFQGILGDTTRGAKFDISKWTHVLATNSANIYYFITAHYEPSIRVNIYADIFQYVTQLNFIQLSKFTTNVKGFSNYNDYRYNIAIFPLVQHKPTKNKVLHQDDFSWLLFNLIPQILHSVNTNNGHNLTHLKYMLTVAKQLNVCGVFITIKKDKRYNRLCQLFQTMAEINDNANHYLVKGTVMAFIILASIKILKNKVRKTYKKMLAALNDNAKFDLKIQQRLYKMHRLTNTCTLKKFDSRKIKHWNEIICTLFSVCNYCCKKFILHKYGMNTYEILMRVDQLKHGESVAVKNRWYLCAQCAITYYCSRKCQKLDWSTHRIFCI